ncbi:MAG: FAD-dependent thymidylate synthase [Desulfobulbaceae bacterium]|nr:FAD-dependent thymidylate synthase [Desulfobulbaceae bacterium]
MNIIPPSYTILDNLDHESLAVRIEYCGRVCYKSEDKIDHQSAIPFAEKMAEHGHNSVLEMGVITLKVTCTDHSVIEKFFATIPRFLHIDHTNEGTLIITGSVRAFREMFIFYPNSEVVQAVSTFLAERHPYFYANMKTKPQKCEGITVQKLDLATVDNMPAKQRNKHRHIAVKFVINRAVTHEIVRHRPCSFLQESQRYCRYSDNKFGGEITFIKPLFFNEDSEEYKIWEQAMLETEKLYFQLLTTSSPQAARTVLPNSCKTELIVYANFTEWQHIFNLRTTTAAEPSMREVMIPLHEELISRYPDCFS